MEKLTLKKPIMINGEEVKELNYDFDSMTARDKLNASKRMKAAGIPMAMEELDADYHLFLFGEAVTKADSSIDTTDIFRMSAKDAQKATEATRSFFYLNSED